MRRRGLLQARGKVKSWCLRKGGLEGGYERLGTYLSFGASDGFFFRRGQISGWWELHRGNTVSKYKRNRSAARISSPEVIATNTVTTLTTTTFEITKH